MNLPPHPSVFEAGNAACRLEVAGEAQPEDGSSAVTHAAVKFPPHLMGS